ncbi:TPA: NYN domain-containing protein [Pseudomonas aeruginosa]|nr:NYN domain-containing protein [Pseudomonas aeruginosa]
MRIAVFVDYWNLQLTVNNLASKAAGSDTRIQIDWRGLGQYFASQAHSLLGAPSPLSYEGAYIYTSFNPNTQEGIKFKGWASNWLNRQPGVHVEARERKPKALPSCPACHKPITHCPHAGCGQPIVATTEKGVDTLLVTDLIRLSVQKSIDAAVVASADADMIPAVEFVQSLGLKVIQAGFPPYGSDLAKSCWGSFDVMANLQNIRR